MLVLSLLIAHQTHQVQAEAIGRGKPMVAIPGGPGFSGRSLWGIGFGMRDGIKTYLFDQHGTERIQTKASRKITLDGTIQDLELLRKKSGHKKWIVFGQSWGVVVALVYAARHPEAVDQLVLTSIPGLDQDGFVLQQNLGKKIPADVQKSFLDFELDPSLSYEEKLTRQVPGAMPYYFHDVEFGQRILKEAPKNLFYPHVFLALQKHILNSQGYRSDLRKLKTLKAPVTMIQGQHDPCGSAMPYRLKEQYLPKAKIELVNYSGHFPWIEEPGLFFNALCIALKVKSPAWIMSSFDDEKAAQAERALRVKNNWPFGPTLPIQAKAKAVN